MKNLHLKLHQRILLKSVIIAVLITLAFTISVYADTEYRPVQFVNYDIVPYSDTELFVIIGNDTTVCTFKILGDCGLENVLKVSDGCKKSISITETSCFSYFPLYNVDNIIHLKKVDNRLVVTKELCVHQNTRDINLYSTPTSEEMNKAFVISIMILSLLVLFMYFLAGILS